MHNVPWYFDKKLLDEIFTILWHNIKHFIVKVIVTHGHIKEGLLMCLALERRVASHAVSGERRKVWINISREGGPEGVQRERERERDWDLQCISKRSNAPAENSKGEWMCHLLRPSPQHGYHNNRNLPHITEGAERLKVKNLWSYRKGIKTILSK